MTKFRHFRGRLYRSKQVTQAYRIVCINAVPFLTKFLLPLIVIGSWGFHEDSNSNSGHLGDQNIISLEKNVFCILKKIHCR